MTATNPMDAFDRQRTELGQAMGALSRQLAAGDTEGAMRGFGALVTRVVRAERPELTAACHLLPGRSIRLSVCRIPAVPRSDKPLAVFLLGLCASLLVGAAYTLTLLDRFDVVVCSLPGHSGSGETAEVSIGAFAEEIVALVTGTMPNARNIFMIGQSLGGLVALEAARRCPAQIRNVILLDVPFRLTRAQPSHVMSLAWHATGANPFQARICREVMGFDPETGVVDPPRDHYALASGPFNCLLLYGGTPRSRLPSFVEPEDLAALRAQNPALLIGTQVENAGHAMLADAPAEVMAELERFLFAA